MKLKINQENDKKKVAIKKIRTKLDIKIKWNIINTYGINWKINKVKKASKAKERAIKRMKIKININTNWRTQLIFGWADMKIEAMRENRKRGRKKAH